MSDLTYHAETTHDLAKAVQCHVSSQPWGSWGNDPVPLEIYFDVRNKEPWAVGYVIGLNRTGTKRRWARAAGKTLDQALLRARRAQRAEGES